MLSHNIKTIRIHIWPIILITIVFYCLCAILLYTFKVYFGWFILAIYAAYEYKNICKIKNIKGLSTPNQNKYYLINIHGEAESTILTQPYFIGKYFSIITLRDWKRTIATLCIIQYCVGSQDYKAFTQNASAHLCNKF